jgi:hypothetical protein
MTADHPLAIVDFAPALDLGARLGTALADRAMSVLPISWDQLCDRRHVEVAFLVHVPESRLNSEQFQQQVVALSQRFPRGIVFIDPCSTAWSRSSVLSKFPGRSSRIYFWSVDFLGCPPLQPLANARVLLDNLTDSERNKLKALDDDTASRPFAWSVLDLQSCDTFMTVDWLSQTVDPAGYISIIPAKNGLIRRLEWEVVFPKSACTVSTIGPVRMAVESERARRALLCGSVPLMIRTRKSATASARPWLEADRSELPRLVQREALRVVRDRLIREVLAGSSLSDCVVSALAELPRGAVS